MPAWQRTYSGKKSANWEIERGGVAWAPWEALVCDLAYCYTPSPDLTQMSDVVKGLG